MKKFFSTLRDIANINASWNAFTHHTKSWTKTCIIIKHFSQLFYEKLPRWCGFLGLNIFVKKWRHSLEYQLNWICSSTSSLSSETTSSVILSLTWPHKCRVFLLCATGSEISLISQMYASNSRALQGLCETEWWKHAGPWLDFTSQFILDPT